MAKGKAGANAQPKSPEEITAAELRRLAKVIAYAAVRSEPEGERARFLDSVGYTSPEIAEMMGIKAAYARTLISRAKRAKKKRQQQTPQG